MRVGLFDFSGHFHAVWHAGADQELGRAREYTVTRARAAAEGFDVLVVCCEGKGSWRKERDERYKANREPKSAQMIEELRRTEEALAADGFPVIRADGYEADDIIATLSQHCTLHSHQCVILSNDKDFAQCVDASVTQRTDRGEYDSDAIVERFGVPPERMVELQALCGDKADNVPGVPGVGPKTAAKLLNEYDSLLDIVAAAHDGQIGGKLAEKIKLADASGDIAISAELVTLRTDALTPEQCEDALVMREPQTETATDFEVDDMDISEQLESAEAVPEPEPTQPSQREPAPVSAEPVSSGPGVAMVQRGGDWQRGLEPRDMSEAKRLAKYVLDSRLFSSFGTPQAALLVILSGRELGIGAMSSLRSFHIVEGRPSMSAQLIKGLIQASPVCEYFRLVEVTADHATFETKRVGEPEPTSWTYTMKDAEAAGLTGKKNWRSYPKPMMCNRCIAELGRMVYPDVCANLYTADELGSEATEDIAA